MRNERHPTLDDPMKWGADIPPPFFNAVGFQARIDRCVGLNREGKSILRLSWAPSVWTSSLGERVKRYWVRRYKEHGQWVYVSPPRFVFEKRIEREAYWEAHQQARFQTLMETAGEIDLGPPPEEYYVYDSDIAAHDSFRSPSGEPQCCARAWAGEEKFVLNDRLELVKTRVGGRSRCWGLYREPDESDMARVEKAVREMREDKYYNPYAPMSAEQILAIEANANLDTQRMVAEVEDYTRASSDDFNYSYGWRLQESSAKKLSHGRYHFLGQSWKAGKNGLAVPV